MSHGVNNVVHADPQAEIGKLQGIARSIGPFPGIANVGIQGNCHHNAAFIVIDALPARDLSVLLIAGDQVLRAAIDGFCREAALG